MKQCMKLILLQCFFTISSLFLTNCEASGPVVTINDGTIEGIPLRTRGGRTISGFLGIPYAQPPIGNLRFASPVPLEANSLKNFQATKEASECIQSDYWDNDIIRGSEDCLYLYVYTPITNFKKVDTHYPVLVFLHGGDYLRMNGSYYSSGPEYLLDKNILLVGINSRLNILGYMSTNDVECPGNFGMKDQYLAFQWIHNNIKAFGGDPSEVTLFGYGSGAVSAHMHSMVDKTKGLFNKLILDGAVAWSVGSFALNPSYADRPKILARALNCTTSSSKAMIDCLRKVDAKDFVRQYKLFGQLAELFDGIWTPCNEPNIEGAYFTSTMKEAVSKIRDIPTMYGTSAQAGLYMTRYGYASSEGYKVFSADDAGLTGFMETYSLNSSKETVHAICSDILRYYNSGPLPKHKNKTQQLQLATKVYTDSLYNFEILRMVQHHLQTFNSTVYVYQFNYRGVLSMTSKDIDNNQNVGVDDGDTLIYLFPIPGEYFRQNGMTRSSADMKYVDIMVDFFTSFMIEGKPSTRHYPADLWQPFLNFASEIIIGQNECRPAFAMGESLGYMQLWDAAYASDLGMVHKLLYGEN